MLLKNQNEEKSGAQLIGRTCFKNTALILLVLIFYRGGLAQNIPESRLIDQNQALLVSSGTDHNLQLKKQKCLAASRWLGALAGSSMGLFSFYIGFSSDDIQGPSWKTLVIAVPTTLIGSWVGYNATEWATRQIMRGEPKPIEATLKGLGYGFVDGAIIGTASMITLLTIGYLTDGITFNTEVNLRKVTGMATLGGTCFGGLLGFAVGGLYGPSLSLYLNF